MARETEELFPHYTVHQRACLNVDRPLNKSWICSGLHLTAWKKKDSFPSNPALHGLLNSALNNWQNIHFLVRPETSNTHITLRRSPLILIISAGVARMSTLTHCQSRSLHHAHAGPDAMRRRWLSSINFAASLPHSSRSSQPANFLLMKNGRI